MPFDLEDKVEETKENKKSYYCNLTGKMQRLTVGCTYLIKASYSFHKQYGHQYEPISVYPLVPKTAEEQVMLLKSIIPEKLADNLVKVYPNIVEDVVNGKIDEIDYSKVNGVRELTWKKIKIKIVDNYIISDIIVMLKPLGVTFQMIKKLLDAEPNPALLKQQIQDNPYIITKIRGIGFKKADEFALKLKPELINSHERLISFIRHYFSELGDSEGHTWVNLDILKSDVSNNVPECLDKFDWILNNNHFLHIEDNKIGLHKYYKTEKQIYDYFKNKINQTISKQLSEEHIKKAISIAEEEQGYKYTEEQLKVIHNTLNSNVSFITGLAGTGKSSIMRAILKAYHTAKFNISSCALSAMAASRIEEATNYPASTIHRLLGCQGENKFLYNQDNLLITDVVLLDEASMVNASLFLSLLKAIGDKTRIIICGDYKQLPPIGYGNIFSDLIHSLDSKCVNKLTKPMRQALKSGILSDANTIRKNKNPIIEVLQPKIIHGELQDMYYLFRDNREKLFNIAINTYLKTIEKEGIDNVTIITPRRQGCKNSSEELNKVIQEKLLGSQSEEIAFADKCFKLGAKVMQTVNDYDKNVFNGEIGTITEIGVNNKKEKYCIVEFPEKLSINSSVEQVKLVDYKLSEITQLDLAYALTTHKLQGSSRQTVIGIIDNTHFKLLDNCMLYTLLTRAKKKCLLLAEPDAFLKCIKTSHNARNTWLKEEIL